MGFVGPVTRLGDTLIRPHDIEIRLEPNGTTHAATITHIARLGFEVRIDLTLADGQETSVQVTREESRVLDLAPGKPVYVRPRPAAPQMAGPARQTLGRDPAGNHALSVRCDTAAYGRRPAHPLPARRVRAHGRARAGRHRGGGRRCTWCFGRSRRRHRHRRNRPRPTWRRPSRSSARPPPSDSRLAPSRASARSRTSRASDGQTAVESRPAGGAERSRPASA